MTTTEFTKKCRELQGKFRREWSRRHPEYEIIL